MKPDKDDPLALALLAGLQDLDLDELAHQDSPADVAFFGAMMALLVLLASIVAVNLIVGLL
ncbi:hypothetical protein [Corynebacterium ulceribovis]|uniref:hypothetical protein n=1 Tax=Corynebacterium ulceribovis TaxID=487732 RepID=UPI000362A6A7|nr:hypothetical protein [Corynebacterium ulceribovis]